MLAKVFQMFLSDIFGYYKAVPFQDYAKMYAAFQVTGKGCKIWSQVSCLNLVLSDTLGNIP